MQNDVCIEMQGICKYFGTVAANENASLEVKRGEIHALLGENGSGKSTLMNMLAGIYSPDAGTIKIEGEAKRFASPHDSLAAGIGMVHQHFKLVEVMSAAQNISAGSERGIIRSPKKIEAKVRAICEKYGLELDPAKKVYNMSVGEKQTVEIVKMLYRGASMFILDEPTAVLTPQEAEILFDILRNMKKLGCAIIIITHKLNEVMEISDRVTVLRNGATIGTVNTSETNPRLLTEMMVGKSVELKITREEPKRSEKPVLEVSELSCQNELGRNILRGMSFSVYGGEIFGVAGIAGSGQKELCEIVAGMEKSSGGSVKFLDEEILGLSPIDILRRGVSMSFVPEDRLGMGLVAGMDITNNVLLRSFRKNKGVFVDRKESRRRAEEIVERYDVKTPSVNHILRKLSGGNIQKVLLGREVELNPKLLITAYPVRGLDIGASYNIYDILNAQKKAGVAVLFIGEDLDVLLALCDRLLVLHDGAVMDIVDPKTITKEEIGLLMLGHRPEKEAR
ncbi:MAG: ABC transporter ATP-binding protein [Oscillospiraceae bacterium]|nr:ABC transporter ATP-binding protein [Oscillospiraceae bacterium]